MMNLVRVLVFVLVGIFSAGAHAVTIDFSDYDGNDAFLSSYTSQGYVVTGDGECNSCLWVGDSPPADGAGVAIGSGPLSVSRNNGNSFGLFSFQFTEGAAGIADYTVIGFLKSGEQLQKVVNDPVSGVQNPLNMVTVVFSPEWQNLSYFTISTSGSASPPIYDNFVLTAVPVPAAVWLFASALGLLGLRRRRSY